MSAPDPVQVFLDMAERAKVLVAREQALQALTEQTFGNLKELATSLTGEQKVALVTAMGFRPVGDIHDDDCIRRTHGSGFRCNCVPPPTMWSQPNDVAVFRKETWDDRRALAEKWSREGSHGREKEEE